MNNTLDITTLVNAYVNVIASGDTNAFRQLWTGKDNTLVSIGKLFNGIDDITDDFLIGTVQRKYESIRLVTEDIKIIEASESMAVVIFRFTGEAILRNTLKDYSFKGLETQVLVKDKKSWKFQHIHYSKRSI